MLKAGLTSVTFRHLSAEHVVRLAREAGLQGIEWGGDVHVPHGELERAKQVRQLTAEAGLEVVSYGSYYRVGHPAELSFRHVVLTAVSLGAPTIRVWAGKRASSPDDEIYRHQVMVDAQRIVAQAAKHNITVAFEYHERTLTDSPQSTIDLIKKVGDIRSLWQPFAGLSMADNLAALMAVSPSLAHIHVFSWRQTARTIERLPLVAQESAWLAYLKRVALLSGTHFALLEFVQNESPAQFKEDAATLLRLFQRINDPLE